MSLSPEHAFKDIYEDPKATQELARKQARNKRRNFRQKVAKYMKTRGVELWPGTQHPPRMRKVLRFLKREHKQ